MNKFTKASIATGAGIVLLLGGAGTLAYWNADADAAAGAITSGTLTIDTNGDGQWQDVSSDVSGNPSDITSTTFLVVPGDTLEYTESFEVGATGDNLRATVSANFASIDKGTWGDQLTVTTSVLKNGTPVTSISSADDGADLVVKVTLAFAFNGTPAAVDTNQGVEVDLSDLAITLTQTRAGL